MPPQTLPPPVRRESTGKRYTQEDWDTATPVGQAGTATPEQAGGPPQAPESLPVPDEWQTATPMGSTATPIETRSPWSGPPEARLFNPPPPTTGMPQIPSGPPDFFSKYVFPVAKTGLEVASMFAGPGRLEAAIPAFRELPALVRVGGRMLAAGGAASSASVVANTLMQPGPPPGAEEIGRQAEEQFKQGAIGEGIGGVISEGGRLAAMTPIGRRVAQSFRAPFAGRMTARAKEATEDLEGHVTPGQVVDSHFLRVLDNIMQGSLFGGGRYRNFIAEQGKLVSQRADELLGNVGGRVPVETAGKRFQQAVEVAHQGAKDAASKLYADVDALAGGTKVPLQPLQEFAVQEAERRGSLAMSLRGGKGTSVVKQVGKATQPPPTGFEEAAAELGHTPEELQTNPAYKTLLTALSNAGVSPEAASAGEVSFEQAHQIRSSLMKIWRDADRTGDTQTRGIASQFLKRINGAMTDATKDNPELRQAYQTATRAWGEMANTFERGVVAKAAKAEPREVAATIIRPGRVDEILKARKAAGPEAWQQVQAAHLESMLRGTSEEGIVSGNGLAKRLGALRPETIDAVYPRGTADQIRRFASTLQEIQGKTGGNLKMWIQLAQGGAIAGVATGTVSSKALGILLAPKVISSIVLNPKARQWLTTGLEASRAGDTSTASRAAGQLLAWLYREQLIGDASMPPPPAPAAGAGPLGASPGLGGRAGGPPPAPPR